MMKKRIITFSILVSLVISIICLAVFLPHFQFVVRYSGGVLELEFEDGSKQYVADGGIVQVRLGSKCQVRIITSTSKRAHTLYRHNGSTLKENEIIEFDEIKTYYFDLYESGGNYVSIYRIEVAA